MLDGLSDDLAVLLPRLLGRRRPPDADVAAARYWMFEAVLDLLGRLAAEAPVLFVVDDLHWARESTAGLFEHVARARGPRRLCLAATVRDPVQDADETARGLLADLARHRALTRVALDGLDDEALTQLAARLMARPVDAEVEALAAHLGRATGGNPFFVGELWGHVVDLGAVRRSGARGFYRFHHHLVAQALTDAQGANARRRGHLRLAEAFAAQDPDRLHVIAGHYRRAVPLVAPAVPAQWDQAHERRRHPGCWVQPRLAVDQLDGRQAPPCRVVAAAGEGRACRHPPAARRSDGGSGREQDAGEGGRPVAVDLRSDGVGQQGAVAIGSLLSRAMLDRA